MRAEHVKALVGAVSHLERERDALGKATEAGDPPALADVLVLVAAQSEWINAATDALLCGTSADPHHPANRPRR